MFLLLAPRVCADCRRRRARCVRGDGGGWRSVCWMDEGSDGIVESRAGLGMA